MFFATAPFASAIVSVGDGTKTPTEDDTINQIRAGTHSQKQPLE